MRYCMLLLCILWMAAGVDASVEEKSVKGEKNSPKEKFVEPDTITRLQEIRESLKEKKMALRELQKQIVRNKNPEEQPELKIQQEELIKALSKLNMSFEQIATGGVDISVFSEQPEPPFDWKKELELVAKPILDSLKELTEKPRKIEQLRNEIERLETLLQLTQKTHLSLRILLKSDNLSPEVREKLTTITENWEKREADVSESLEMARYQLNKLQTTHAAPLQAILDALGGFIQDRGMTLFIILIVISGLLLFTWMMQRLLLWLYPVDNAYSHRLRQQRVMQYGLNLLALLLAVFGVMTVLYARNDVLLLGLTLLGLLMVLFSLRTLIPRYADELRILLNMGAIRQDERVIYQGIPFHVHTIGMYSTLVNPELEGVIRLPTATLSGLISRPRIEELWFPTRVGDHILLEDDSLAIVQRQTVETVQLKLKGSCVLIASADFISRSMRNLSRNGFIVPVTFGVDYRHQAICLTEVPQAFYQALSEVFQRHRYASFLENVLVEFKEAGANSLDYQIIITMKGEAAPFYFTIGRLIQKTCVEVCNRQQWGIPFAQLTVHQGEGFEKLSANGHTTPSQPEIYLSPRSENHA